MKTYSIEFVAAATRQTVRQVKDAVSRGVVTPSERTSESIKSVQFTVPQFLGLCIASAMQQMTETDRHTCDMVANHVGKMTESEIETAIQNPHGAWNLMVIPGHSICPDLMPMSVIAGDSLRHKIKQKFRCEPIGIDLRSAYGKLQVVLQAAERQK